MTELAKTFDPAAIEARWYAHWEDNGLFRPDRPDAEPWTIVNPPPNVTGSLHIGHALDNTLQDILTRHARLKGKDALWVVGTDHAGIATQMVVERQMALQQQKRTDFTRDAFVEKVWAWKAESGGEITRQLRRLGCSMDWANERFTMDEGFSRAVLKVFVELYREGLLYRDKRLVNWDPGLGTAISDLEVETCEVQGKFWHLTYPLADGSGSISVATTRPETMLADMAVAVHPADERYAALVGRQVRLPITGRLIPIIADEHADPDLGSGAVKITPGHDFNDFEVGRRAGIRAADMLNILDATGSVVQTADRLVPDDLIGLDRFEARTRVVALLEEAGALERVEDRVVQTPYGDRSGVVIEPWLTDQWYVDAATLAKPAIEAVRSGAIRLVPKTWEKTFFNWMENIQPWCVSRQLWWGHRIPAWYGPINDEELGWQIVHDQQVYGRTIPTFVAESWEEARAQASEHYGVDPGLIEEASSSWAAAKHGYEDLEDDDGRDAGPGFLVSEAVADRSRLRLWRDPDVLDTWFSSALWPFATLGWPEQRARPGGGGKGEGEPAHQLAGRYPNDVLVSGFDILFFWDARMMMQGLHFMGDVPFKTLYLHGLVRAADGAKMSKSKGNTVDPLGLIDRYGADALRFFMAAMESQGRDIKMDEKRVEGYRNFATKLWNAARFCQANGIGGSATLEPPEARLAVNKWIVAETVRTVQAVDLALAEYRFDAAANAVYQFVWSRFCDWYLELIKGQIHDETRAVAGWVLDQILIVLHPFMPFITEELWHALTPREHDLIVARWPMGDARAIDPEGVREIDRLIEIVSDLRRGRIEARIEPKVQLYAAPISVNDEDRVLLDRYVAQIRRMANLIPATITAERDTDGNISVGSEASELFGTFEGDAGEAIISVRIRSRSLELFAYRRTGFSDVAAERASLQRGLEAISKERDALSGRLNNPSFVERAKPEAVEKARADHADKAAEAERLTAALARLG